MNAIEDQTSYVPSGLVSIPKDNAVRPEVKEGPYPVSILVHENNQCYVDFSDTDGMTDYFHKYFFNSLKKLIEFLLRDSSRHTHTISVTFVNDCIDGVWPQAKKDRVLNKFKAAGVPVEPRRD